MQQVQTKKLNNLSFYNLIAVALGILVGIICKKTGNASFGIEQIKPIGQALVNLMSGLTVPLVFFSIIETIASLKGVKQHKKMLGRAAAYFLGTTVMACIIGIVVALIFKHLNLFKEIVIYSKTLVEDSKQIAFMQSLTNIIPADLVDAVLKENVVMILIFSLLIGFSISAAGKAGEMFNQLIVSLNFVIKKMVSIVVKITPISVFAMCAWLVSEFGYKRMGQLKWLLVAVLIGYVLHIVITFGFALKFFAKIPVLNFFKKIFPVIAFAMTSTSSIASIPVAEEVSHSLGTRDTVTSLVIPSGSVVNMDGTAVYLTICAIFFATGSGVSLSIWQMILMTFTVILAVFGTAGVPGAGFIMLSMVMGALKLDVNLIMLIYIVDKIFDIGRTCLNVTGDMVASVCIEQWCREAEKQN
ncbi:MAG: dicarboxylate/amino acid:cation symporter [Synergistaceae bacterium]|nr:dicarboxylate/amino acid:cation symporter [Synergistaceae bacterium]